MVGNIFVIPAILLVVLYVKSRKTYVVHPKTGDSVVLITGCDSGIGNAAVQRLLKEGYYVISTVFTDQVIKTYERFIVILNVIFFREKKLFVSLLKELMQMIDYLLLVQILQMMILLLNFIVLLKIF